VLGKAIFLSFLQYDKNARVISTPVFLARTHRSHLGFSFMSLFEFTFTFCVNNSDLQFYIWYFL